MNQFITWRGVIGSAAAALSVAVTAAAGDDLPRILNFADVTGARVQPTVAEDPGLNEKEVEIGDYDNDGRLDVVIANAYSDFGQRKNKLYRNQFGVLLEVSDDGSIPGFAGPDVARNAFFRDYDGDGWLDIIIVNDNNTAGDAGRTKIYMNIHTSAGFQLFDEQGLARLGPSTGGAACSAVSFDPDNDGDMDLYVGNYPGPSQDTMYLNTGEGFFLSVTTNMVPTDGDYTVDVASGDMNGDGKEDLLVSNWSPNFIYYNDNLEAGDGVGDFKYTGSTDNLGVAGTNENAMEPGDFDNDGDLDVYWSNRIGAGDRVLVNTGNDGSNRAQFVTNSNLPPHVVQTQTRKATVADLNGDGRVDIVVMAESARPAILRNTTVNGDISFIEWTPGHVFPDGNVHSGWHAGVFDSNNDGDLDIFVGGHSDDHLFEQVDGLVLEEAALPTGVLPALPDFWPVAVVGAATAGESDTYVIESVPSGGMLSVVLTGLDDYRLEVLAANGDVLETVDRGGLGIEEAIQVAASGERQLRVTVLEAAGAQPAAGDLDGDEMIGASDLAILLGAWGVCPACPADLDGDGVVGPADLATLLSGWGEAPASNPDGGYLLEVLNRS